MKRNSFSGPVKCEWVESSPRDMILSEDLIFCDKQGKEWLAPAGELFNGASIPRLLWTGLGSPFVGKYRRAAVLHDIFCGLRTEPWVDVHEMFYNAMLADGVPAIKALAMFDGVYTFGPRWDEEGNDIVPEELHGDYPDIM